MSSRLQAYLDDLNGRLAPHLDDARRAEVLAELRSHLTLSARDAEAELDMTPDEAARAALRALGPVATVAEDLVRQHRGGTARSAWRVALPTLALYVLGYGISPLCVALNPGSPLATLPLLLVPPLCLVVFMVAVWRSRRWLIPVVAAGIAATSVVTSLVTATPAYRAAAAHTVGGVEGMRQAILRDIDGNLALAELGAEGYVNQPQKFLRHGQYAVPRWNVVSQRMLVPFLPILVPIASKRTVYLVWEPWSTEGAELWRQNGVALRAQLQADRAQVGDLEPTLETAVPPLAGRLILHSAVLGLVNVAVLSASNRRRRSRIRRDPHLA
jgi:hypothetical protein